MKFVCEKCHTKYSIADQKVRRKVLKIRCKNCANIIVVRDPSPAASAKGGGGGGVRPLESALDSAFDSSARRPRRPSGDGRGGLHALAPALAAAPDVDDEDGEEQTRLAPPLDMRPAPQDDEWYLAVDGHQFGPMSFDELGSRVKRGEARAEAGDEAYVWRDGFDDWVEVNKVPELRPYVPPPPPPRSRSGLFPASTMIDGSGAGAASAQEPSHSAPPPPRPGYVVPPPSSAPVPSSVPLPTPAAFPAAQPQQAPPAPAAPQQRAELPSSAPGMIAPSSPPPSPESMPGAMPGAMPGGGQTAEPSVSSGLAQLLPAGPAAVPDPGSGAAQLPIGAEDVRPAESAPVAPPPSAPPSSQTPLLIKIAAAGGIVSTLTGIAILVYFLAFDGPAKQHVAQVAPTQPSGAAASPAGDEEDPGEEEDSNVKLEFPPMEVERTATKERAVAHRSTRRTKRSRSKGQSAPAQPARKLSAKDKQLLGSMGAAAPAADVPGKGKSTKRHHKASRDISAAEVGRLQRTNRRGLTACYQRALKRDNTLSELKAEVQLTVGSSGIVKRVRIKGIGKNTFGLGGCLQRNLRRWVFRPLGGSESKVVAFPLVFRGS